MTLGLQKAILFKLKELHSPEQIVGRARLQELNMVSHETIYQWIWRDKKAGGDLHNHLRRYGKRYRKRGELKDHRGQIVDRIDISQRPAIVEEKLG